MLRRILLVEVKGLKPEGKYLLARLAQSLGTDGGLTLSVRELAKRFDLPATHVSDALTTLVTGGVLSSAAIPDGRGRPKKQYVFDRRFLQRLEEVELSAPGRSQLPAVPLHQAVIERLLEHEKRGRSEAPKEREDASQILAEVRSRRSLGGLTAVNRLLLAVLLTHADHFGVVSTVGSSALCKATGLSKDRLLNRVLRLVDQGLLRTYVAGAASTILAKKEMGTYFINLGHPELVGSSSQVLTLVCISRELSEENEFQHSYRLFEDALARKQRRDKRLDEATSYSQLLQYLANQQVHVFKRIQLKLGVYAARLLSEHWSELTGRFRLANTELREQIESDFWFEGALVSAAADSANSEDSRWRLRLVNTLYQMSRLLAIDIKARLKALDADLPLAMMDYVIIPQSWEVGYVRHLLLAQPRTACDVRGCLIVDTGMLPLWTGQDTDVLPIAQVKKLTSEAEILPSDQYRYGMRTSPRDAVTKRLRPG